MPIGPFRTYSQPVNLRDLEERFEAGAEATRDAQGEAADPQGVGRREVLGIGELSKSLSVSAHGFSKTAREKIEAAGGTVTWLRGEPVERKPKTRRPKRASTDEEPESEKAAQPPADEPDEAAEAAGEA